MVENRYKLLADGDVGWVFPELVESSEAEQVGLTLATADDLLRGIGQKLGVLPEASWPQGVPMFRLMFLRLGPEPSYSYTDLLAEGLSNDLYVMVWLESRPDKPWKTFAKVDLVCDVDPDWCKDHELEQWSGPPADNPLDAARQVHAAALWAMEFIMANSIESLRSRDPRRGHAPIPRDVTD